MTFGQHWLEKFGYCDAGACDWAWWGSTIHPRDIPRTQEAFSDHLAGKTPWFRVEYRMSLARPPDERVSDVELVPVLERCLQIADHQIRHRARAIRSFAPSPTVRGVEGRVVQLFLNLIVNAAQAIPEGAADRYWIRVTTDTRADGRAVVEISDNGAGIAANDLSRIYEPFFTTSCAT